MKWRWKSWSGAKRVFDAALVEFGAGHVLFMNDKGQLLLAVRNDDVIDLHPFDERKDPRWWGAS